MESYWVIWLAVGLVLAAAGALLGALEAVLWQTPHARMDSWPRSPRLQTLAADFSHPRDCLLTFLVLGSALVRGAGWWALWAAGCGVAHRLGGPSWLWSAALILPTVLLGTLPAALAGRRPRAWERPLLRVGGVVLRAFGPLFDRLHPLLARVSGRVFPWASQARLPLGPEEAETLVRVREEEGEFSLPEAEALTEVLRLSRSSVRTYMTPRVDVVCVPYDMTNDEVRNLLLKRNLARTPVIGETPDEVLGILDARTFGRLPPGMHFTEALLPPSFVPDTMEASELLASFLKHRQPLAVVLDEFGGVEGVVTLDDFLEGILGDAVPRAETDLYIERIGDGRLLASGAALLDDLSEYLGFDARRDGIETIGGYITSRLGRLPKQGSSVTLGPWKVTVRAMAPRRVREVALQKVRGEEE